MVIAVEGSARRVCVCAWFSFFISYWLQCCSVCVFCAHIFISFVADLLSTAATQAKIEVRKEKKDKTRSKGPRVKLDIICEKKGEKEAKTHRHAPLPFSPPIIRWLRCAGQLSCQRWKGNPRNVFFKKRKKALREKKRIMLLKQRRKKKSVSQSWDGWCVLWCFAATSPWAPSWTLRPRSSPCTHLGKTRIRKTQLETRKKSA